MFSVPFGPWNPDKANHFAGNQSTKSFFINEGGRFKTRFFSDKCFCLIRNTGLSELINKKSETIDSFFDRILYKGVSNYEDDILFSLHESLLKTKEIAPNSTRDLFHFDGEIYVIVIFVSNRLGKHPYRNLDTIKSISDDIKLFEGYSYFTKTPIAYGKCSKRSFHIRKDFAKKRYIKNVKNVVIGNFDSSDSVVNKNSYVMCERNGPCVKFTDMKFLGLNLME